MPDFVKRMADKVAQARSLLDKQTEQAIVKLDSDAIVRSSEGAITDFSAIDAILTSAADTSSHNPLIQQTLAAIRSPTAQPVMMVGLLERFSIHSRTKTYKSRAEEIQAMLGYMAEEQRIYAQQVAAAQLPDTLRRQHEATVGTHKVSMLQMVNAAAVTALAISLTKQAASQGMSLEIYLGKLADDQALAKKKQELDIELEYEVKKRRQLDEMERLHETERANTEITVSTRASLAMREQEKALRKELREAYVRLDNISEGVDPDTGGKLSESLKVNYLKEVNHDILSLEKKIERFTQIDSEADSEA